MKQHIRTLLYLIFIIWSIPSAVMAQEKEGKERNKKEAAQEKLSFVDANGDGYNDNAPDHDNDGIHNGLDPDWKKNQRKRIRQYQFVDLDGDGIHDDLQPEELKPAQNTQNMHREENGSSMNDNDAKALTKRNRSGKLKGS